MPHVVRPKPSRRRFTLADLLILATAIGLGLAQFDWFPAGTPYPYTSVISNSRVFRAAMMSAPFASALTLALFAIPVRTFRSRLRRLALFPGAAACGVATVALLLIAAHWAIQAQASPITGATWLTYYERFTFASLHFCGMAVAVALIIPVLAGWTRFRPDAIDRLRLMLGLYWVTMSLVVGAL
jgi:hypothetical protein